MDDKQIQEIADRVIGALQALAPRDPSIWADFAALTPIAALVAAIVAAVVGYRNLKQQQRALAAQISTHESTLKQKSESDAKSEWWRRTQWSLDATTSVNTTMYGYGTGVLVLMAKSKLADPEDKELLDAVWQATSTEMQDEDIERLIKDAQWQENLTEEETASVQSYYEDTDDSLGMTDNDIASPVPKEAGKKPRHSTGTVDAGAKSRENRSNMEKKDG
ncbi:hypothetical protein [Arthrobacter cryoconiti]|uniref:Uncharacterized protein n=1 Tax=Arthrobacter cryoconiti TaxID=748907 RepID=A0ABV8R189_9MICC|nr:hypothetical protein [Arthrobacter cryoconiti]MCC9068575.1 hypothetical protein [Arthrobacter cryoconiti]